MNHQYRWILTGLLFSVLWASASTATKIALKDAQPLVVAICRFAVAALVMLGIAHGILRQALPHRRQWAQLAVYGLLNITIYLGLYVVAMDQVTASIGALTVAASPVFISFLSFFLLKKPLSLRVILALVICISGFVVVAWPLLGGLSVTFKGLALLLLSMLSYSAGTIYFTSRKWQGLHLLTINGWQTLLGGLFLFPFVAGGYRPERNHFGVDFWTGTLWLAIPVSIGAVLLWLKLIGQDAVKAGLWLFLCPVFGILIAALMVGDQISLYTGIGVLMVLTGLAISHFEKKLSAPME